MTAELQPVEHAPSETSTAPGFERNERCAHSGRPLVAMPRQAPFALLISIARFVIAAGGAIALMAIVICSFRWGWHGSASGELWALFATFVLAIGVLVLYEIRDALFRHPPQTQAVACEPTHLLPPSTGAQPLAATIFDASASRSFCAAS